MIEPPFTGPTRKVEFVESQPTKLGDFCGILTLIDGVPFQELIDRCYERSQSSSRQRRGHQFTRGRDGFSLQSVLNPHVRTVADPDWSMYERVKGWRLVLICGGCAQGCCDTFVTVQYTKTHVHWYNYRHGPRKETIDNFGIITFERQQYIEECERIRCIAVERDQQELREQLLILEQSHLIAENRRNPEFMNLILHPEFMEIGASGNSYTKDQVIAALMIGDQPHFEIRDFEASYVLPEEWNSRIWQAHYVLHATYPDESTRLTRRTSIWTQGRRRMQLKFHQGTPINP